MKAIGIIQNHPPSADGPSDETHFFTGDEKRTLVDLVGANQHPEIYVYEEHGGGEKHMGNTSMLRYEDALKHKSEYFTVPLEKRLGRVAELLCDRENNLHGVMEYNHENPRVHEIMEEIRGGAKYGLSIGLDAEKLPGGRLQNKRFTHVGLTKQPEYGGDPALTFDPAEPNLFGTWLHQAAISHAGMDEILATKYLSLPGMYAAQRTRDRIAKRRPVSVSVGASRPRIDSASLITTEAVPPMASIPVASMSNGSHPSVEPTMSSSVPGHFPNDPAALVEQQQRQQAAERLRFAERELETVYAQRANIEALDAADPSKYTMAKELQERLTSLFKDANVWSDSVKRSKYNPMMAKLDEYVAKAQETFSNHIDETVQSEDYRLALKEMMQDVTKYGAVLQQVGASAKSMSNMRKAEEQLKEEREESKRKDEELKKKDEELANFKKREREIEENTAAVFGKRPAYSNTSLAPITPLNATSQPQQQPLGVPVSTGATRFVGSQIARKEHTVADAYYNDLAPRRDAFLNSPFARTTFNDGIQDILANVAAIAEKYGRRANLPVDGPIGS
jgi:hypothetical protein